MLPPIRADRAGSGADRCRGSLGPAQPICRSADPRSTAIARPDERATRPETTAVARSARPAAPALGCGPPEVTRAERHADCRDTMPRQGEWEPLSHAQKGSGGGGTNLIQELTGELGDYLERKGYASIEEFRGIARERIVEHSRIRRKSEAIMGATRRQCSSRRAARPASASLCRPAATSGHLHSAAR